MVLGARSNMSAIKLSLAGLGIKYCLELRGCRIPDILSYRTSNFSKSFRIHTHIPVPSLATASLASYSKKCAKCARSTHAPLPSFCFTVSDSVCFTCLRV